MDFLVTQNLSPVPVGHIPDLPVASFLECISGKMRKGGRVVQYFGMEEGSDVRLLIVLADDANSRLYLAATRVTKGGGYPALTPGIPSLHLFEREIHEEFGILPEGHPWLKPVRRGIAGTTPPDRHYPFFRMSGEEGHEVGVGPIHAGIVEPGHFRFSCHGERVDHLEIRLGFQHRGVERLFLSRRGNPGFMLHLAESIAGDTVIGHAGTFVRAMEALGGVQTSRRAMMIRAIALELERIGCHLGDLASLSADVAYLTGNAVFGAMRTTVINTSLALCGSRFGRGLIRYGGVCFDADEPWTGQVKEMIRRLSERVDLAAGVLFASSSVMSRFEKTGVILPETASAIGLVGPAARASGLPRDVRSDHPFGAYAGFAVHALSLKSGDVFGRAYIRYVEIMQSFRIVEELLERLDGGALYREPGPPAPDRLVVSLTEGWRGEIAHVIVTDPRGALRRIKIKDPSFHNWIGLALAVRDNGISDFPLCNKSFNLSYCGFDL